MMKHTKPAPESAPQKQEQDRPIATAENAKRRETIAPDSSRRAVILTELLRRQISKEARRQITRKASGRT